MGNEYQYLTELSEHLDSYASSIRDMNGEESDENDKKIYDALEEMVAKEDSLRSAYEIGVRFNIIRSQLHRLRDQAKEVVERTAEAEKDQTHQKNRTLSDDEKLVYVYLFNAQGGVLKTWQKLLTPHSLVEHSVNRPIYAEREQIETLLRSRPVLARHAYIAVIVKKSDILHANQGNGPKDQHGFSLLRLRQGALTLPNVQYFMLDGKRYDVSKDGSLLLDSE